MAKAMKVGASSETGTSVGHIAKIDAAPVPESQPAWAGVLKAFNPLGLAADVYARTLAYRIEVKRLDLEAKRVEEQAKIAHNVIDKHFRLKMEELEQRRLQLDRFYDTVQQQLSNLHIERMKVLQIAEMASAKAMESGLNIDERRLFKEMATEAIATLPQFGAQANASLDALVKALPAVQMPTHLLGSGS